MRYTDLATLKNNTARINAIRDRVSKLIYEEMCKEFGEEYARYIEKEIGITPNGSCVPKNTVVIDVGDTETDGFVSGICVEISVKVKKWWNVETKRGTQYGVTLDDYDEKLEEKKKGENL